MTFFRKFSVLAITALLLPIQPVFAQDKDTAEEEPVIPTSMPVIILDGGYAERSAALELFGEPMATFHDVIKQIDRAKGDEKVGALALQVMRPMMGFAQATELREKIVDFQKSGKPVIAVSDMLDTRGYYLASAADEITMSEVGAIISTGMSLDLYFFRDMLAKLGVRVEAINTGRFKNALEPFTHQEMSDGTREQYGVLLDSLGDTMMEDIAKSREMTVNEAEEALFSGPHLAGRALELDLITDLAYPFDALDEYAEDMDLELDWEYEPELKKPVPPPNFFTLFSGLGSPSRKRSDDSSRIALVYALGPIVDGYTTEDPFSTSQVIASDSFIDLLEEAVDDNAEAIVIRVNSPGGSAVASDRIWNKIEEIRDQDIPVVISMGNVAASGGYYISMNADQIFVQPTTITGSIGVIAGRMNLKETYEKIGVSKDSLSRGQNNWIFDETVDFTPEQKEFLSGLLEETYDFFTAKAADGRGMDQDEIKELGGGRVWTGVDAVENGLADEIGGLESAIAWARDDIEGGEDLKLVTYPKEKTLTELIEEIMADGFGVYSPTVNGSAMNSSNGLVKSAIAILSGNGMSQRHEFIQFLQRLEALDQMMTHEFQVLALDATVQNLE